MLYYIDSVLYYIDSVLYYIDSMLYYIDLVLYYIDSVLYVTQSDKTGLIAYFKLSRNDSFKYLVCCSSPMVEAMYTKFSHVLYQFLTFQSIYRASSQQPSFPPF